MDDSVRISHPPSIDHHTCGVLLRIIQRERERRRRWRRRRRRKRSITSFITCEHGGPRKVLIALAVPLLSATTMQVKLPSESSKSATLLRAVRNRLSSSSVLVDLTFPLFPSSSSSFSLHDFTSLPTPPTTSNRDWTSRSREEVVEVETSRAPIAQRGRSPWWRRTGGRRTRADISIRFCVVVKHEEQEEAGECAGAPAPPPPPLLGGGGGGRGGRDGNAEQHLRGGLLLQQEASNGGKLSTVELL